MSIQKVEDMIYLLAKLAMLVNSTEVYLDPETDGAFYVYFNGSESDFSDWSIMFSLSENGFVVLECVS